MTRREQYLSTGSFGVLGLVALAIVFHKIFWSPYTQYQKTIADLTDEINQKDFDLKKLAVDKKKILDARRLVSLPPKLDVASTEYGRFLKTALRDSGLSVDDFQGPANTETPKPAPAGAPKKAGHIVLAFQVRAHSDWPQLVRFLDLFQKAPYLHRIKNMNLERPESTSAKDASGKISLLINIETLVVNGSGPRPDNLLGVDGRLLGADVVSALTGGVTGWSLLLRGPALLLPEGVGRRYADLDKRNPFVGGLPPPPPPPKVAKKETTPSGPDLRLFYRLMSITHSSQKAVLRNLLGDLYSRQGNITLSSVPGSGYTKFRISGGDGRTLVQAEVLHIDHRDVYFKADGKIYGIHLDQNLADAMRRPLTQADLEKLGLEELWSDAAEGADGAGKQNKLGKRPGR